MYAVIFRATLASVDESYHTAAATLRQLAFAEYGCQGFVSSQENNQEIAISYWPTVEHIAAWKQNVEHLLAQQNGRNNWYSGYTVEVVEVLRSYQFGSHCYDVTKNEGESCD